jgi:PAS domain S-box-containing protein
MIAQQRSTGENTCLCWEDALMEFFAKLFSRDFMPHGVCYLWDPVVLWLNVISDGLIAAAYYAIPFLLFRFARARRDITFQWVFVAFGAFILACGTTHLLGAVTVWAPVYRLDGVVKAITAAASLATCILLVPIIPRLIALPSPAQLADANQRLEREIEARRSAEAAVRSVNAELETRVAARTAELERAQARLRRLTDALPQMVWVLDENGVAQYFNGRWTEYTGVATRDHDSLFATVHPDDRQAILANWRECIHTGLPLETEYRVRRHDGEYRWFLAHSVPVADENGRIEQWLGSLTDVDDKKRHAESVANALKRVEAEMERRKTLERQLMQAQKMEAIGRLAGGVAHDFNNLLTVILGYTELLAVELRSSPSGTEFADEVRNAAQRATALTNQLLAFGRRQTTQPAPLDINQAVLGIERMLRRIIGEDITLETHLAPSVPTIMADPSQLDQVVMNLAVNARDAMPDGGALILETASIEIGEEASERYVSLPAGHYAMLAVSDTGIGMDAETRAHLFEPFYTTKEVGKGTGLGLAIVYGVVKQNGGEILVYSEPGHGATFKIYLPATDAPIEDSLAASLPVLLRGTERILLVEDDVAVRGLVERMLERQGYDVTACGNPRDALAILHSDETFDLMMTDVVMPGMGGVELAAAARKLAAGLRVLYVSGYTAGGIAHRGVLDPSCCFLQKPFTTAALATKIREALDR